MNLIRKQAEVHCKLRSSLVCSCLTVSNIKFYLHSTRVILQKLQLDEVTTLLIASKYERTKDVQIADFCSIFDEWCYREKWWPLELTFRLFYRPATFPKNLKLSTRILNNLYSNVAHYLIEQTWILTSILHFRQSVLGTVAVLLAIKIIQGWFLRNKMTYRRKEMCSKSNLDSHMLQLHLFIHNSMSAESEKKLKGVMRKFSAFLSCNISMLFIAMTGCLTYDMEISGVVE